MIKIICESIKRALEILHVYFLVQCIWVFPQSLSFRRLYDAWFSKSTDIKNFIKRLFLLFFLYTRKKIILCWVFIHFCLFQKFYFALTCLCFIVHTFLKVLLFIIFFQLFGIFRITSIVLILIFNEFKRKWFTIHSNYTYLRFSLKFFFLGTFLFSKVYLHFWEILQNSWFFHIADFLWGFFFILEKFGHSLGPFIETVLIESLV